MAKYWAEELSLQSDNNDLRDEFAVVYKQLKDNETIILDQIAEAEGKAKDIGGYFLPDDAKAEKAMRPSAVLNQIIDAKL